jgi:hypothetical protein
MTESEGERACQRENAEQHGRQLGLIVGHHSSGFRYAQSVATTAHATEAQGAAAPPSARGAELRGRA